MAERAEISVQIRLRKWRERVPGARALCRRAAARALKVAAADAAAGRPGEIAIVLGSDAFIARLNRDFRGLDQPTDVLSFPAGGNGAALAERPLGDVVIAFETAARDARAQGKRLSDHLAHLVIHGVLHLLGYDHGKAREAARMETLEIEALRGLGIGDPYRAPARVRAA